MNQNEKQKYLQLISKKLVSLTVGCLVVLVLIFYLANLGKAKQTYLVIYVFIAGLIGGFVSIQQRLPNIGLNELKELSNSWLSILLIPINGGIFAIVLMLMFLSGIIEGAMFPKYNHPPIDRVDLKNLVESFSNWLKLTFPEDGPAIAKLLFWSFVAGFSERFVPQIIRRTAENADNQANATDS